MFLNTTDRQLESEDRKSAVRKTKDRQSETISESNMIVILSKCVFFFFFIKDLEATLNKQSDSICAKLLLLISL